jgi:hypothetical protein
MSSNSAKTTGKSKSDDLAIVGAFGAFLAVAAVWIWLFFGFVQPWLDAYLYGA